MGRVAAGAATVAVAGASVRTGAEPVTVGEPVRRVGETADAYAPAERALLTATRQVGELPFPLDGFGVEDLVCLNNFGTCRRNHMGVDIGEARVLTDPVSLVACVDAEVTQVDQGSRPGRYVVIRGDDARWYRYHHLDEFADGLAVGDRVVAGQSLGTMGATGNTVWPHLHFEVWEGDGAFSGAGTVLDPVPLLTIPETVLLRSKLCD